MNLHPGRISLALFIWSGALLAVLPMGCGRSAPVEEKVPPAPVKAAKAMLIPLAEWKEIIGTTQPLPDRIARISAPVEGRVVSVLRDADGAPLAEGQVIKAGTVIAQLDTRVIAEQLKQAEFAVRQAEIEVKRLEALTAPATANGQLPLVSRIELQRARIVQEDVQSKQRALVEQVRFYTLTSPITGRLGLMQVVSGQTLSVGLPVAEVIDLSEIDVLCFVPPHVATRLALDQLAQIVLPAADGPALPPGKLVFLAVQAQADTGNFAVKVRFPNSDLRLRANTVLTLRIQSLPERPRLTIPETALLEDQDPPGIVIVTDVKTEMNKEGHEEKLGKARNLRAIVGIRDRTRHVVELLGLEDAAKQHVAIKDVLVVTEGAYGLHDGDELRIEEEETKDGK